MKRTDRSLNVVTIFDLVVVIIAIVLFTHMPAMCDDSSKLTNEDQETESEFQSFDSLFLLYQPYLGNISAYEPMYFLVGADPEKSRFQFSFKYRFFNPQGPLAENHDWVKGLHFAFTQTSYWDLKSNSMPFYDSNYKPGLFFLSPNIYHDSIGIARVFIQTGYLHESNGRAKPESRSTNFLYAEPILILFSKKTRVGLQIAPRIWTYVNNDNEGNPDLKDYRGYFDLGLKCGMPDSFVLENHFGLAKRGGSISMDLTYPLNRFFLHNLDIYLHLEYVNRYAESLIDYKKRTDALRFGLAIVR